ncbi:MAG: hypothetical protein IJ312_03500 [Treponema sp.]|nr:hypothetical protein [Treponema sp.]
MDYKNYPSVVEISDLILQRVYAFQGNIISFSYFQGFCSFVLTNCNSEEIVYDKTAAISYKKNAKTFSISFDVKKELDSNFCQIDQSELFLDDLQNSLSQIGAFVTANKIGLNSFKITFFVNKTNLKQSLIFCGRYSNEYMYYEKSLNIKSALNGFWVTIMFYPEIKHSSLCNLLASYSELFNSDFSEELQKNNQLKRRLELGNQKYVNQSVKYKTN